MTIWEQYKDFMYPVPHHSGIQPHLVARLIAQALSVDDVWIENGELHIHLGWLDETIIRTPRRETFYISNGSRCNADNDYDMLIDWMATGKPYPVYDFNLPSLKAQLWASSGLYLPPDQLICTEADYTAHKRWLDYVVR